MLYIVYIVIIPISFYMRLQLLSRMFDQRYGSSLFRLFDRRRAWSWAIVVYGTNPFQYSWTV